MYRGLVNYLRGQTVVEVACATPAANLCIFTASIPTSRSMIRKLL